jgi:hypothetical protein
MPHDAITRRQDVIPKVSHGGHDMVVLTKHDAPAGPNGEVLDDPFERMDIANATWMHEVLTQTYPGIPWRCIYDGAQKMAYVSVPILMGINKFWAINLTTDELSDGLLRRAGGQLLERYGVSRGRFNLESFLDARAKHSALVLPSRKVPE